MAGRRTAARARPRKATRTERRIVRPALRWLLLTARPRSASDLLALIFVCLAVGTFAALEAAALLRRQSAGAAAIWCVVLLLIALAARLSGWWRSELESMTWERVRSYLGSALLVFVALSICWHILSVNLGLGDAYLLLGPVSSAPGAVVALGLVLVVAIVLLLDVPAGRWMATSAGRLRGVALAARERQVLQSRDVESLLLEPDEDEVEDVTEGNEAPQNAPEDIDAGRSPAKTKQETLTAPPIRNGSLLPGVDIFVPPPKGSAAPSDLDLKAQRIEETLASFNVAARVVGHHCGPVVTQFDIQPERGVKVRRITELQNDLALALAAPTIRIQAPVPGKPVVGIEIPNASATMVVLRELVESEAYRAMKSPLRAALGKDVAGKPVIIDLAKMPHLLIAGATGSGKSVCVNALISCLLSQNTPDQVRLLMVDPKVVELAVYNGVPHLLSPVVTQMDRVVGVLQWALREMERRYQLFADTTVRNIQRYNEKMEANGLKALPYIVVIVDELADLMMVAPEDVEDAICRLAQLARACGIHLVIATQRPSVDVVTGLIKANFPARIAFAMTSQVDSRTILDSAGAEKLLGRGDMLYMPPDAAKAVRLQGAYLSDQEIERLVEFWHRSPLQAAASQVSEEEFAAAQKAASEAEDELLGEATRVAREYQHASVSLLQRRLKIGYARAARLMDQLEAHHVVGPADGSKQRPVLDEH